MAQSQEPRRPRPAPGYDEATLRRLLVERPAFRVMSLDGLHWLDPFARRPVAAAFDWQQRALAYLLAERPWRDGCEPAGLAEVMCLRWFLHLRQEIRHDERLRWFDQGGRWLNPLTAGWETGFPRQRPQLDRDLLKRMAACLARAEMSGVAPRLLAVDELRQVAARQRRARPRTPEAPVEVAGGVARPATTEWAGTTTSVNRHSFATQTHATRTSGMTTGLDPGRGRTTSGGGLRLESTKPSYLTFDQEMELAQAGYRIRTVLGRGGMGVVYLAQQMSLDREVALKVRLAPLDSNPTFVQRVLQEARAGARVTHRNVVTVFDVGRTRSLVYIAMEHLSGGDAEQLVRRLGQLPVRLGLRLVRDCLRGLAAIHGQGLIHRDVKPSNLFLTPTGDAKLGDLGIAAVMEGASVVASERNLVGTPVFMPPEQCVKGAKLDVRTDLYASGVTLYHLLTGRLPYRAGKAEDVARVVRESPLPDPRRERPELPGPVADLVRTLMAREPAARPATADIALQLVDELFTA